MKHYPLDVVAVLGYVFTWIIAVAAIQNGDYGLTAATIAFAHLFEATVTTMIARKGRHSCAKDGVR